MELPAWSYFADASQSQKGWMFSAGSGGILHADILLNFGTSDWLSKSQLSHN